VVRIFRARSLVDHFREGAPRRAASSPRRRPRVSVGGARRARPACRRRPGRRWIRAGRGFGRRRPRSGEHDRLRRERRREQRRQGRHRGVTAEEVSGRCPTAPGSGTSSINASANAEVTGFPRTSRGPAHRQEKRLPRLVEAATELDHPEARLVSDSFAIAAPCTQARAAKERARCAKGHLAMLARWAVRSRICSAESASHRAW